MNQDELALAILNKPQNIHDYIDDKIIERRWKIEYVGGKCFYLTNDERKYFLNQIKRGAEIIQIGDLTLTKRFSYILPIRNEPKKREFEIIEGVAREK